MKTSMMIRILLILLGALLSAHAALAYESKPKASDDEAAHSPTRQYTFAWQFIDDGEMAPRGGTSKGEQPKLLTEPSEEWKALQQPGLSSFERDRRAILAMAGDYRASFDFIEVANFTGAQQPTRPYQSWGTEKVYVLVDEGERIVLQHVLVMRIVKDDGSVIGPFVTKHWRQDWIYEPTHNLLYRGMQRWDWVSVPEDQRRGRWAQIVYQVDDSPRYGGVAQWHHHGNYSTWEGGEEWRPLPRREWSVREDYQVLVGSNRHSITPTGWVHEQQNNKVALAGPGQLRGQNPVLAREFGYNRYERVLEVDFSAGDAYVAATADFWAAIRNDWQRRFDEQGSVTLRGAPDKDRLFMPTFEHAQRIADGEDSADQDHVAKARELIDGYMLQE